MRRGTAVLLVLLLAALPGAASAAPASSSASSQAVPETCTSGPAHAASAARPHRVDPEGDPGTLVTINGDPVGPQPDLAAFDLRAIWVGVEETAPGSRIPRYTINAQVTALEDHPAGAVYYLGIDDYTWASAAALSDGTWEFGVGSYTVVASGGPLVLTRQAATHGSVDPASASIRIVIPEAQLPGETTKPYARSGVRAGGAHSVLSDGGFGSSESYVPLDSTGGTPACTAVLDGLAPEES